MLLYVDVNKLKAFLEACEDAEMLTEGEYVADLFEVETPVTVNIKLEEGKARVLAAAYLLYDEGEDGWYMGDRIEDEGMLNALFAQAMGAE